MAPTATPTPLFPPSGANDAPEGQTQYTQAIPREVRKKPAGPRLLKDAERIVWPGYQLAVHEMPNGDKATCVAAYEWFTWSAGVCWAVAALGGDLRTLRHLCPAALRGGQQAAAAAGGAHGRGVWESGEIWAAVSAIHKPSR
jgi:hypothetical protein